MSDVDYRRKCLAQKINVCAACGAAGDLVVHHINGDRSDNRLSNLTPLCDSCHKSVHRAVSPSGQIAELQQELPEECVYNVGAEESIAISVGQDTKQQFRIEAAKRGMSMSELAREILLEQVPSEGEEGNSKPPTATAD